MWEYCYERLKDHVSDWHLSTAVRSILCTAKFNAPKSPNPTESRLSVSYEPSTYNKILLSQYSEHTWKNYVNFSHCYTASITAWLNKM